MTGNFRHIRGSYSGQDCGGAFLRGRRFSLGRANDRSQPPWPAPPTVIITMISRPDVGERLASLETSQRYEVAALHKRIDQTEQRIAAVELTVSGLTSAYTFRLLALLDGPAVTKLALAVALVAAVAVLKVLGQPDLAAKLGKLAP